MTYKVIDTREKRVMTKGQTEAMMRAFESWNNEDVEIVVAKREHLGREFKENICCDHAWVNQDGIVAGDPTDLTLKQIFEEKDLGDRITVCERCHAVALWERGEIFAYDAVALQPAPAEKPERKSRPNPRDRKRQ